MRRIWTGVTVGAVVAGGVLSTPSRANAQSTPTRLDEDTVTTRMLSLGGRAEATGMSSAAMFGNPAMLTALRAYHTDLFGFWDPTIGRWGFGSAVVDSTRETLAAGLSYVYSTAPDGTDSRYTHDTRMNISLAITSYLGVGATVRYLNTNDGPEALNGGSLTRGPYDGFTLDAGIYARPASFLVLSVSGHNLNNQGNTATPITMDAGAAVMPIPNLTIVFDALIDFRTTAHTRGRYSGGVEYFFASRFPVRVGYAYDDIRGTQALTGGIGYVDETLGVELGIRQGFVASNETTMMLSLRYFYHPTP